MDSREADIQTFTLKELSKYFHLPINEAAAQLGVCATVLKKICRNNGVKRWPQRKIKSINNMIEALQQLIDDSEGDVPKLNMDMDDLLAKRKYLLENPDASYKSVVSKYAINSFNSKIQKAQSGQLGTSSKSKSPTKPTIELPSPTKSISKKKKNSSPYKLQHNVNTPTEHNLEIKAAQALASLANLNFPAPSLPKSAMNPIVSKINNRENFVAKPILDNYVSEIASSVQYSRVPIQPSFTYMGSRTNFGFPLRLSVG